MKFFVLITIFIYLWLSYQNIMWLHASSFCYNEQNVLILGNSGSGKSSLTLMAHSNGASVISEENTCVCFDGSSNFIAINKHDIAIFDDELSNFPDNYSDNIYKSLHSKENKTMIHTSNLSYTNAKSPPNIVILLSDQKNKSSYAIECGKFNAIKRIIQLHPCFNSYQSNDWLRMVINMVSNVKIYEVTPSYNKEKTFTKITEILTRG